MELPKGEKFVSNYVLGLGAVAGFFTRAGFDLEGSIVGAGIKAMNLNFNQDLVLGGGIILAIITYIILFWQLRNAFHIGGLLGLTAITLGLLGAFFLPSLAGVIMFSMGLILGFFSPYLGF